jgi:hypothetical protein
MRNRPDLGMCLRFNTFAIIALLDWSRIFARQLTAGDDGAPARE